MNEKVALRVKAAKAPRRPLPDWIGPQLATLRPTPPTGQWFSEVKFDGYRLITKISNGQIQFFTRAQNDWTQKFSSLIPQMERLHLRQAFLDGEVVVLDDAGVSHFQDLQNALRDESSGRMSLFLFDIMFIDGYDLRDLPLAERKNILKEVLKGHRTPQLLYSKHYEGPAADFFEAARTQKLEGIICKDPNLPYSSERTATWQKIKCIGAEEFVIGGYTVHSKLSNRIGALLLGTPNAKGKQLQYNGKVGTGFSDQERMRLFRELKKLQADKSPFHESPFVPKRGAQWVRPAKIAQIQFTEKTRDQLLRHPSYLGERLDKSIRDMRSDEKGHRHHA